MIDVSRMSHYYDSLRAKVRKNRKPVLRRLSVNHVPFYRGEISLSLSHRQFTHVLEVLLRVQDMALFVDIVERGAGHPDFVTWFTDRTSRR